MKKTVILTMLACAILCAKVNALTPPNELRVGLVYNSVSSAAVSIVASGGVSILDVNNKVIYENSGSTTVSVSLGDGVLSGVVAKVGGQTVATAKDEFAIAPQTGELSMNSIKYRGRINVSQTAGKINIINVVELDDYVRGVVAKEIGGSSPAEALKAQAVCARTYAVAHLNKHKTNGFDVCITEHCQVYGGMNAETTAVNAAVDATKNVIATYNGAVADLVFAASTGGWTENVEYVWGGKIPYLVAVPSPNENPNAHNISWKYEITPENATKALSSYGLGNIVDIQILEQTPRGVTTKLNVVGTVQSKTFTLESCRTLFGYSGLQSQAYTLTKTGTGEADDVWSLDASGNKVKLGESFDVQTAQATENASLSGIWAIFSGGKQQLGTGASSSGAVEKYVFTGRGWGHLVGMSQEGAIAMAKGGSTYQQILKHYYTGITLE